MVPVSNILLLYDVLFSCNLWSGFKSIDHDPLPLDRVRVLLSTDGYFPVKSTINLILISLASSHAIGMKHSVPRTDKWPFNQFDILTQRNWPPAVPAHFLLAGLVILWRLLWFTASFALQMIPYTRHFSTFAPFHSPCQNL